IPPWSIFQSNTLSGIPAVGNKGAATVELLFDSSNTQVESSFPISVIDITSPVISEFMADNEDTLLDEDGDSSDWIELFNPGTSTVNLAGWYLTDDPLDPTQWPLPSLQLGSLSFAIVFASKKAYTNHANFKLHDRAGEYLALVRPDFSIASSYTYPKQQPDVSYGRFGDYESEGFLLTPTPGRANAPTGYVDFVETPLFSLNHGFYESLQNVAISCTTPGATLVITTNGSTPTLTNGVAHFLGPATPPSALVPVSQTTVLRARAFKPQWAPSSTGTRSYLFVADILTQQTDGSAPPGWPGSCVNGQVFDYGMDPDVLFCHPPAALSAALTNIPMFSLVADLENWMDAKTGIWVHAENRGDAWERPVSVEWISAGTNPGFQVNGSMKIRGGVSRSGNNPKHSMRLYFRDKAVNFPFFGTEGTNRFKRIDLRATQGNSWHRSGSTSTTFIRDVFARDCQRDMGNPYTRSRYHHVMINGIYFGLFQTQERLNRHFGESYFGGDDEDYDVVKSSTQPHRVEALDGDGEAWANLFDAATAGFASDTDYFAVQGRTPSGQPDPTGTNLVDVANLIDYMLIIFYTGQTDGPVNINANVPKNFYGLRPRDGRFGFRFFVHDNEDSLNGLTRDVTAFNPTGERLTHFNPKWLHQQLMQNPRYIRWFGDRAHRHLFDNGALTPSASIARHTVRATEVAEAVIAESARWGDAARATPLKQSNWSNAVTSVASNYFPGRTLITIEQLRARGLYPDVAAPAICPGSNTVHLIAQTGTIYYTIDQQGDPAETGTVYTDPIPSATIASSLHARVLSGGSWSAIAQANLPFPTNSPSCDEIRRTDGWPETGHLSNATWVGINFTVSGGPTQTPFINDSGALYDAGRGTGWLADLSANTRQRRMLPEPLRDSFVFTSQQDTWEGDVSNGWYLVRVCVGDAQYSQGPHFVDIEGHLAVSNVVTEAGRFEEAEQLVQVNDGRLTLVFGEPNAAVPPRNTTPNWLLLADLAQSDTDGDGIVDLWEINHVGALEPLGHGDFDRDGSSDLAEFFFQTDPLDAGSFLALKILHVTDTDVSVQWFGRSGVTYQLEWTEDLENWDLLPPIYSGTDADIDLILPSAILGTPSENRVYLRIIHAGN
ncbi:MAG: CotH kinase family protein, partial [Verrucomicrobiota bacterium]